MNLRFYIICITAVLALAAPSLADSNTTATIQGGTYLFGTFEPLNNTVVEINSIPPQSMVAKNGRYSFELVPGEYIITAKYYRNNTLTYFRESTFEIEVEGDYVHDLILRPVSENLVTGTIAANMGNSDRKNFAEQIKTDSSIISYLLASTLFLLLGVGYKLSRKRKKIEKNAFQEGKKAHIIRDFFELVNGLLVEILGKSTDSEIKQGFADIKEAVSVTEPIIKPADNPEIETVALRKLPLSADLQEIMDLIRGHKGRITQKDLRSRLNYSEVKVSILLSELEKRGLIKKLKNGRENIVILIDEKH